MKTKTISRVSGGAMLLAALALLPFAIPVSTAVDGIVSGPPEGTALTPIRCYANSGPFAGREEVDLAAEIGDGPGALLFIHELNRNTVPLIRGLDNMGREFSLFGFKAFPVRLFADRTAGEEELLRVNGSLKLGSPIVLSLDGLDGPGNYALNRKGTLSLVLVNGGVVQKSVGYVDTAMADLPVMRKMIEDMVGVTPGDAAALERLARENLPEDEKELRALAARQAVELQRFYHDKAVEFETGPRYPGQMQRGGAMRGEPKMQGGKAEPKAEPRGKPAPAGKGSGDGDTAAAAERKGKPPEDDALNALLRSFIRQTNDDATTDRVYADIVARGGESDELGEETVEMFKLMLSFPDRYGTGHAQSLARKFLDGNAGKE